MERSLLDKVTKLAKLQNISVSLTICNLVRDAVEQAEQFNAFFADPLVRKQFTELFSRPDALKVLSAAMGQVGAIPAGVQLTLNDILNDGTFKKD